MFSGLDQWSNWTVEEVTSDTWVPLCLCSCCRFCLGDFPSQHKPFFLQGQIHLSDSEIQTSEDSLSSVPVTLTGAHVLAKPPHQGRVSLSPCVSSNMVSGTQ